MPCDNKDILLNLGIRLVNGKKMEKWAENLLADFVVHDFSKFMRLFNGFGKNS